MSERFPLPPDGRPDITISLSSEKPGRAVYSIDDDIVVAAVDGRHVRLYGGDGLAEEFDCESHEAARTEAMGYARFLLHPPGASS